jgi:lipid-A-disaccharide synthase
MAGEPRPRVGGAVARRALKELLRAIVFPFQAALWLPTSGSSYRRTDAMLRRAAALTTADLAARTASARQRFRARLGATTVRRVFVSCGEHSGEEHAIDLARALRAARPDLELIGFGGHLLAESGVEVAANLVDHAVMGFRAVVGRLPFFAGVLARFLELCETRRPDAVVLLDNPGLHLILASEARRRGIPVLYYICPQYWAWAPWRIRRFARAVDGALALLPFEPEVFEAHGVSTGFAGHPMLGRLPPPHPEPRPPLVALLPGSRRKEIAHHVRGMLDVWRRFHQRHPEARAVLPQPSAALAERVRAAAGGPWPDDVELRVGDAAPVLAQARAALVKSGTSSLQAALCRTPAVVVYRVDSALQVRLGRVFVTTPWFAAPNLVLGRRALPEILFHGFAGWDQALAELSDLFVAGQARQQQLAALDELRLRLQGPGMAREAALWLLGEPRQ